MQKKMPFLTSLSLGVSKWCVYSRNSSLAHRRGPRAFVVGYYIHARRCRTSRLADQSWNLDQAASCADPIHRMSALGP